MRAEAKAGVAHVGIVLFSPCGGQQLLCVIEDQQGAAPALAVVLQPLKPRQKAALPRRLVGPHAAALQVGGGRRMGLGDGVDPNRVGPPPSLAGTQPRRSARLDIGQQRDQLLRHRLKKRPSFAVFRLRRVAQNACVLGKVEQ
jgi:hypothetical protein